MFLDNRTYLDSRYDGSEIHIAETGDAASPIMDSSIDTSVRNQNQETFRMNERGGLNDVNADHYEVGAVL